jgi:PST family polysaccharide transporter
LKRRAAVGAFWVSVETWGQQLLQFALFLWLSRLLGPEAYGLLSLALIVNVIGDIMIVGGGWSEALIQRPDLSRAHATAVFWVVLALSGVMAVAAVSVAPLAAGLLDAPELASLMPWLALQLPLGALSVVPMGLLRRELQFAPIAARSILAIAVAGAAAVVLALNGAGVWSLVVYQVVHRGTAAAVLWLASSWRPTGGVSLARIREVLPFVSGAMSERVVLTVDTLSPRLMIGYVMDPVTLGHLNLAHKFREVVVQLFGHPFSRVMFPSAARLMDDRARLTSMVGTAMEMAGLLVFPMAAGVALTAPALIPFVVGSQWAPSVPAVQLFMVIAALAPLTQLATSVLYAAGRTQAVFKLALMAAGLLLALLALSGLRDLVWVAAAFAARSVIMLPIRMLVARRLTAIDMPRLCLRTLPALLAAAAMAGGVLIWQATDAAATSTLADVAGSVLVGAGVYLVSIAVIAQKALRRASFLVRSLVRPASSQTP